jgi:hypothetical protein
VLKYYSHISNLTIQTSSINYCTFFSCTPKPNKKKKLDILLFASDDFYREIKGSLIFFIRYILNKPETHSHHVSTDSLGKPRMDFGRAFGLEGSGNTITINSTTNNNNSSNNGSRKLQKPNTRGIMSESPVERRHGVMTSDDENIRLAPYEARPSTSRRATDSSLIPSSPSPTNEYQYSPRAI